MRKQFEKIIISAFSGIIGVVITIGYQHFFTSPPSFAFTINGEQVSITESELQEKLDFLQEQLELTQEELISKTEEINKLKKTDTIYKEKETENTTQKNEYGKTNIFYEEVFIGDLISFARESSGEKDNVGNKYPSGFFINYDALFDNGNNLTYYIQKKYRLISGTIGLYQEQNDIDDGIWLEFYGDDKFIGATQHLFAGIEPIKFEFDISGVTKLKIILKGGDQSSGILTNGFYLD